MIRTRELDDIPKALSRIGELTGMQDRARGVAEEFGSQLRSLATAHGDVDHIRVFYQVSTRPLFTVSGGHYASELIELCGGRNVFADLQELAPAVDVEAVIGRDPEVMLAVSDAGGDAFSEWSRWPDIAANRYGNHYLIPSDEISRPTTRVVIAGRAICAALQEARQRRDDHRGASDD